MAERKMTIEVELQLSTAENQMRQFVAAHNVVTVPVQSPLGGVAGTGAAGGVAGLGSVLGGGTELAAISAAQAQVSARAAQYGVMPNGASSPNWGVLMQGAMQNAMYPEGASSPNWSYLMAQQGGGAAAPTAPGNGGFFGNMSMNRARVLGIMGAHELGRAATDLRNGEEAAMWARTPEEYNRVYAEGVERAGSGYFGSAVFGAFDAMGAEWTPSGVARQAREMASARSRQDEVRERLFDIDDARGIREAYGYGGRSAADDERASRQSARHIGEMNRHVKDLQDLLGARQSTTYTYGDFASSGEYTVEGGDKLTGPAREAAQADLKSTQQAIADAMEQARFDADRRTERVQDFAADAGAATQHALLITSGRSTRDVSRYDLRSRASRRRTEAVRNFGVMGGLMEDARAFAEQAAQEYGFRREDALDIIGSEGRIGVSNLQAAGQDFQSELLGIQAHGTQAMTAETDPLARERRHREMLASIGAAVARQNRSFVQSSIQLGTQGSMMQAQLADDPLGAQIAGIQGQRDSALAGITETGMFADARRAMIANNANLQEQLARRADARGRSDTDRSLQGASERARFAIEGGPLAGVREGISSLLEGEELDVRGLERKGWGDQAQSRRDLASLQLDAMKSQFYRGFSYQEANPLGVAGLGDLSGIDTVFKDAKDQAAKAGGGEGSAGAGAAGWTPEQVNRALSALESLVRDGITAVAG
jgi:hypothetical protein